MMDRDDHRTRWGRGGGRAELLVAPAAAPAAARPSEGKGPVVARRPAVFRRFHFTDTTRLLESLRWVVYFSILRRFGRDGVGLAELLVKRRERRPRAVSAARAAAADATRCVDAVAALPDAWGSLARSRGCPADRSG